MESVLFKAMYFTCIRCIPGTCRSTSSVSIIITIQIIRMNIYRNLKFLHIQFITSPACGIARMSSAYCLRACSWNSIVFFRAALFQESLARICIDRFRCSVQIQFYYFPYGPPPVTVTHLWVCMINRLNKFSGQEFSRPLYITVVLLLIILYVFRTAFDNTISLFSFKSTLSESRSIDVSLVALITNSYFWCTDINGRKIMKWFSMILLLRRALNSCIEIFPFFLPLDTQNHACQPIRTFW